MDRLRAIPFFADMLALLYHEARHVRWLKKDGHGGLEKYASLINLASNKYEAWRQVQPCRAKGRECSSAKDAERVFRRRFAVGLEDLDTLYAHPGWKHSKLGGNRWLGIAAAVIQLRESIETDDTQAQQELLASIPDMRHNTGGVAAKLRDLDGWLDGAGTSLV